MTVLADVDIGREIGQGDLDIEPYDESNLQPASYDVTLGNEWLVPQPVERGDRPITITDGIDDESMQEFERDTMVINPMQPSSRRDGHMYESAPFILGHIQERISLPSNITADVRGRSSIGRLGIVPHTAGWGDPGFDGDLTLELYNLSPNPIELEAGTRIAQIVFKYTESPASTTYDEKSDAKYQGQSGVTESRIEEDT